ncbi:MAG TPA: TonB-dependent receptor [Candidatus Latescibacteria bacterium]|nr:TonB-dependent receptor [Candidatus Latescibacterota bacterium]
MTKRIVIAILVLFMAGVGFAQGPPTSKLEGKVVDNTGSPLPGVSVEATSPKLVGKATGVTDGEGTFRLFSLPSGIYEVVFTLQGFKTLIRKDVVIQMSQTITLNVNLEQTAIEESVTVIGQSPLIDVKSTVKGQTMTKEVFMSLPRSRNFDGLLSTVPGVQYEDNAGGLSVDGATGTENMWYMDGADITGAHIGTRAQSAIMELVEEVKVTASGYNAEFGGSMGGVVNVITRSGGNAFHGDIMGYYNDNGLLMQGKARDRLRWSPYDDNLSEFVNDDDLYWAGGKSRDDYKRFEGVFNLGGYILKDRLWFFGSFNPQYSRTYGDRWFLSDGTFDTAPRYNFYRKDFVWNGQMKLTAAPFKGMRMSASFVNNYSNYRGELPSINGTSNKTYGTFNVDAWKLAGYDYPNMSTALMLDYSASNNFLVSARAGYAMQNTKNQQIGNYFATYYNNTSSYVYDGVIADNLLFYTGAINYAGSTLVLLRQKQEKYSSNLDLSYYGSLAGEHAFKAGVQFIRDQEDYANSAAYPRVNIYWDRTCSALSAYGVPAFRGDYGYYQIRGSWTSPYGYQWDINRTSWALYLQDSWTIGGRLTLNAGVRTESEYIPSFNPDFPGKPINFGFPDKLAPRLGMVYDVFGDSSLKVFGSFGIYYDVMKLYIAEGSYGGLKWKTDYYTLDNPNFYEIGNEYVAGLDTPEARADQAAGGTYMGTIDFRVPSFDTTDPDLKPVSQREISFGAEKKLTEDLSLSVRLVQKHLINTIEDIGVEDLEAGGEQYFNANPGSPWIQAKFDELQPGFWPQPKAKREYYGMNLSLEKRFSHNWQGGVNYTLSQVSGNYSGLSSSDENGRNSPNVERFFDMWFMMYRLDGQLLDGPLPQDRTHYIKAYGSYAFPFGLTVGVVAYGRSGLPVSTQLSVRNTYIYPNGYGDLGRLPFTVWGDIYAEYSMRIAGKYSIAFNLQVNNFTNTNTWQAKSIAPNRTTMEISNEEFLSTTFDWQSALDTPGDPYWKNTVFNQFTSRYGTWSTRLGVRFSF